MSDDLPKDLDFRPKRNPLVLLGIGAAVVAGAAVLYFAMQADSAKLSTDDAVREEQRIFQLPPEQQLTEWRKWGAKEESKELLYEALKQLAWANDPAGVDLAIKALSSVNQPVQATAATSLAWYGLPAAEKAKQPLVEAFKKAGDGAKPQIAWALVVLGDATHFDAILELYRAGHLAKVQRLGGGNAFDPELLAALVPADKWASLAGDSSVSVRQLVATTLSKTADPKYVDVLIKLLQDENAAVARQAAPGLAKIGGEKAQAPLLKALQGGDLESRKKFLAAIRDALGTEGLVLALETVQDAPIGDETSKKAAERAWYQRRQIMDLIQGAQDGKTRGLHDPRGGDALLRFIESVEHVHWKTRAAIAMAEIGDVRAAPTLAKRMRIDEQRVYGDDHDYLMLVKRNNNERVEAARMLADLAFLYPEKHVYLRDEAEAEEGLISWLHEMPQPHANGLRALAAMGSTQDIDAFRKWANPDIPLPKEGETGQFPHEFATAQSALRYVGMLRDEQSWKTLEDMLKKKDPKLDVTMDSMAQGGLAVLGMTLKALGHGASDGFSEWGDSKAFKPLLEYILDPKNNEEARERGCEALSWVATPEQMTEVAKALGEHAEESKSHAFIRRCLLRTLSLRPIQGTSGALLERLRGTSDSFLRVELARAIGRAGLNEAEEEALFQLQDDPAFRNVATLSLMLGGSPQTAARAVVRHAEAYQPKAAAGKPGEEGASSPTAKLEYEAAREELKRLWFDSFGYWSHDDLESGRIFRWVDNAVAISRVEVAQVPQEWARIELTRQFENLVYDNGPHSFTRVVLRVRLYDMARGEDPKKRSGAIRTLLFMEEQGVLLALKDLDGEVGKLGRAAYQALMFPRIIEAEAGKGDAAPKEEPKK